MLFSMLAWCFIPDAMAEPAVPLSEQGRALWSLPGTSTKKTPIATLFDPPLGYSHTGKSEWWPSPLGGLNVWATNHLFEKVELARDHATPGLLPFGLSWADTPADLRAKLGAALPDGGPRATHWAVASGCEFGVSYEKAGTLAYAQLYCDGVEVASNAVAERIGRPLRQPADLTGASDAVRGWAAYNAGDAAAAVPLLTAALATAPADEDVAFGLGAALVRQGGARRAAYDALCGLADRTLDPWLKDDVRLVLASDGMTCGERPEWPPPKPSDFVATRLYAGPCSTSEMTEAGASTVAYAYSPEGWVSEERTMDKTDFIVESRTDTHERDRAGVLQRTTSASVYDDGTTSQTARTYAYDGAGRLAREELTYTSSSADPESTTYTYDDAGRLIAQANDYGSFESRDTYTYTFDAQGRIASTSQIMPYLGTRTIENTWDAQGRLVATTTTEGPGFDTTFTYDAAGRVLTKVAASTQTAEVFDSTYTYDALGNPGLETRRRTEPDGTAAPIQYVTHDYACWAGR